MQPAPKWQEGLFRHSLILLVATQIGNGANLLFQLLMNRRLPDVEYGILATMLSAILILGTPLEALRTAIAHQVSLLIRGGHGGAIKAFLTRWFRVLGGAALIVMMVGLLGSNVLADFFQLPGPAPVRVAAIVMALTLFMSLFAGALQGVQSFGWLAAHGQVWGLTRLLMAALLLYVVKETALMGLLAQGAGVMASIVFGFIALRPIFRRHPEPVTLAISGWSYFLMSFFVLSGYAVLMNADVMLVKRFFDPAEAGLFARAATIGRSIVFLPLPIAGAMFPKVVSTGLASAGDRRVLLKAVAFTALLIIGSATACTLGASYIWHIFTGEFPNPTALLTVRWIIWAMAPLGLTFLLMNFELAQSRFRAASLLVLLAVAYVVAVSVWHETIFHVLTVLTLVSVTSVLVSLGGVFWGMRLTK